MTDEIKVDVRAAQAPLGLEKNVHIEALSRTLGVPTLDGLSYALRHPETWPKGFKWDFESCAHCAMGLAKALWGEIDASETEAAVCSTARAFAMPYSDARRIFLSTKPYAHKIIGVPVFPRSYDAVSPEMVADAIDAYIARTSQANGVSGSPQSTERRGA